MQNPSPVTTDRANLSPLVSVIMPVYNCAAFVREAIDSVLSQDYENLELIVVDDGSEDETTNIVRTYGSRVHLLSQENAGPAAARNRAIQRANGEYLAFLDGDDYWLPGKLSAQMAYLTQNAECYFVFGRFVRWLEAEDGSFDTPEAVLRTIPSAGIDAEFSGSIYTKLLLDNIVHIITVVIHRSVYERVGGFDESLRTGEDYDFWLRVSRSFSAHRLARDVALYRIHSTSTTTVPRAIKNEYKVLLRALEQYGLRGPHGEMLAEQKLTRRLMGLSYGHGYVHYWRGDACVAATEFAACWKYGEKTLRVLAYRFLANMHCFWAKRVRNLIRGEQ